ncbi:serine hydrolase domain-containing protein [Desulfoluna butyratoxydans]|uniref:Beta-lactamase-related n=1 Tax=Desulfoluna butyratoxydans TaxID=231438 RepID=A0A4V6ILQ4_9BACT|nr:serine hydrolase domain-containing protein [Desulfoluna butyratoxydans]VFQ45938.1 beta-lactamase-related [Desulfoluna butyratoxydans]
MQRLCFVLTIFLLAGCTEPPPPSRLDADTRAALDGVLQSAVKESGVPGVVAMVVDADHILYTGTAGVMDSRGSKKMQEDAIFRIFSMTKPLTSLGIMILAEEGRLSLDVPASDYLPEMAELEVLTGIDDKNKTIMTRPASRPITIRDLLCHTSGVGYVFCSPELLRISQLTSAPAHEYPTLHDPGARWTYGMGTIYLGWIIEKVSGQSLSTFIDTRITGPLDMKDTSFKLPSRKHDRLVATYQRTAEGLEGQARPKKYKPFMRGDSGLLSTARDYGRFIQMILGQGQLGNTRIVAPASVAEMSRNQLNGFTIEEQPAALAGMTRPFPTGAGQDGFGLGFQVNRGKSNDGRSPGSLSWSGIQNTHFWIDPSRQIGVVLLCQLLPHYDENVMALLTDFERVLYTTLPR